MAGRRKTRVGVVVSDKMDKTVVVAVVAVKFHRLYRKALRRTKRYKAHDAGNACRVGDEVLLEEMRPLSKEKRWRVVKIMARRALVEAPPPEVEVGELSTASAPAAAATAAEPSPSAFGAGEEAAAEGSAQQEVEGT